MQKFTVLKGVAAALPMMNVDTDMIIPKQYLRTIRRTGLGRFLFDEMRRTQDGKEIQGFVLNQEPFRKAVILVAGENFGCGSSREHAPWALLDFGIRCVIAPSFADIFYNNCFKNGILPVRLARAQVETLMQDAAMGLPLAVDLATQTVTRHDGSAYGFEVESFRRHCLLNGLDDIGLTLEHAIKIDRFEEKQKNAAPWLYRKLT